MAVLINGNGNEAIYAQQDADWYAALMGGVTMITGVGQQFAYELLDANTIGVKDGVIITKEGRRIQVDTNVIDTFDIPTGAQGTTNYYIIGYHLVTDEQSVQTAETFVQLMENGTDTIPEGSFKEGDDDVYVSLYRVEQNDLNIGTITLLLPTVSDSMQQQISQINASLSDISKNNLGSDYTITPTTLENAYVFPSDGYVHVNSGNGYMRAYIYGANGDNYIAISQCYVASVTAYSFASVFVKKGMKCYREGSSTNGFVKFVPLE